MGPSRSSSSSSQLGTVWSLGQVRSSPCPSAAGPGPRPRAPQGNSQTIAEQPSSCGESRWDERTPHPKEAVGVRVDPGVVPDHSVDARLASPTAEHLECRIPRAKTERYAGLCGCRGRPPSSGPPQLTSRCPQGTVQLEPELVQHCPRTVVWARRATGGRNRPVVSQVGECS